MIYLYLRLILGVKTCEVHEWRTVEQRKQWSQNNRYNEHNSDKTKKNFTCSYTEDNRYLLGVWNVGKSQFWAHAEFTAFFSSFLFFSEILGGFLFYNPILNLLLRRQKKQLGLSS